MPLPVSFNSNLDVGTKQGYQAPFKSSGGNFYAILRGQESTAGQEGVLSLQKAADPTSTFTEVATTQVGVSATESLACIWCYQDGDTIHIIVQKGAFGSGEDFEVFYLSANISADTFATEVSISGNISGLANHQACSIVKESTGSDLVAFYQGDTHMVKGSNFSGVDAERSTDGGSTWDGNIAIDNAGEERWTGAVNILGTSDRVHNFFNADIVNDFYQRTLRSDDTLETFPSAFDAAAGAISHPFGHGGENSGTVRCPYQDANGQVSVVRFTSADTPSDYTIDADVGDNVVRTNSTTAFHGLAQNGADFHLLYADNSGLDVYHDDDVENGGTTDTNVFTSSSLQIFPNIYDRSGLKLGYIVRDTAVGTIKYNEVDIAAAAATQVDVPLDPITMADLLPAINTGVTVTAPLDTIAMADFAPDVFTGVRVDVPLDTIAMADFAPALNTGVTVTVPLDAITMADFEPAINTGVRVDVPLDPIVMADFAPAINTGVRVDVPLDTIVMADLPPTIGAISVPLDTITMTDFDPFFIQDPNRVDVPLDTISMADQVPVVATGVRVDVPLDTIAVADFAPDVFTGVGIAVPLDTIAMADFEPAINTGVRVDVPLDAIVMVDLVPGIATGVRVLVPLDTLAMTDFVPEVNTGVRVDVPLDTISMNDLVPTIDAGGGGPGPAVDGLEAWLRRRRRPA